MPLNPELAQDVERQVRAKLKPIIEPDMTTDPADRAADSGCVISSNPAEKS